MKKSVIFLGSLIALTLVVIFGRDYVKGKVNSAAESPRVTQQQPKQEIPRHITYHMMFRHIVWLKTKAAELESRGESGAAYKNRYQMFAGLTDGEAQLLNQVATDTVNRVKEYDTQIEALVKADRAKRANQFVGKPLPSSPPALNPEVTRLDRERQNAITAGYTRLRDGFSAGRFAEFEKFVQKEITSQITTPSQGVQRQPLNSPRTGLWKGGKY